VTEPRDSYSPERRTALLFTGTGTDGAYHAGAMRALQEAGVKLDIVGGRGIGAVSAVLGAVDGSAQLWEASGSGDRPRSHGSTLALAIRALRVLGIAIVAALPSRRWSSAPA
jgi:predicted acylesterase/phospholipase RssA